MKGNKNFSSSEAALADIYKGTNDRIVGNEIDE